MNVTRRVAATAAVAIFTIAGLAATATRPTTAAPTTAPAGYRLVWSDEFDVPGRPDPAKWTYEQGFVRNGEPQAYTDRPENARVEDGCLVIEARKEHAANPRFDAKAKNRADRRPFAEYTSACVTTQGRAAWTYGRVEVRAKLPNARGAWPAIWTLGTAADGKPPPWPLCGETDVMELWGDRDPNRVEAHLIWARKGKTTAEGGPFRVDRPDQTFHVYAAEWTPAGVDFFIDDHLYKSVRTDAAGKVDGDAFRRPQYLLLNLAVDPKRGAIDETAFPMRYTVDWARFYQKQ